MLLEICQSGLSEMSRDAGFTCLAVPTRVAGMTRAAVAENQFVAGAVDAAYVCRAISVVTSQRKDVISNGDVCHVIAFRCDKQAQLNVDVS